MSGPFLSVVVLTHNEEANLPACLASLQRVPCRVLVVDSGSTDGTVKLAEAAGAVVVTHPFVTQAAQLQWALDTLPLATPWVMRLDADEWVTAELADELARTLPGLAEDVSALYVKRRVYFMGRWIRHGGYYPTWLLRLWRPGRVTTEPRAMDEHMIVRQGRTSRLAHDIVDENHKGLGFWIDKHNHYAARMASVHLGPGDGPRATMVRERLSGSQEMRKRWLQANVYERSPLFFRALLYWGYRYWIRLGFLDGVPGLVFHFLQAFWYRFLVDAKVYEARRQGRARVPLR